MKSTIAAFLFMGLQVFAGAPGQRDSNPYAKCSGTLDNQQVVQVELRSWSFPFSLTGTVLLGNISEAISLDHSSGASQINSRQSRPLRLAANVQLRRDGRKQLAGTIEIVSLGNGTKFKGTLICEYAR